MKHLEASLSLHILLVEQTPWKSTLPNNILTCVGPLQRVPHHMLEEVELQRGRHYLNEVCVPQAVLRILEQLLPAGVAVLPSADGGLPQHYRELRAAEGQRFLPQANNLVAHRYLYA